MYKKITLLIVSFLFISLLGKSQIEPTFLATTPQRAIERAHWVDSVYNSLSLNERIGQMFIYTVAPQLDAKNINHLKAIIKDYKIGGLLFSGGEVANQVKLTNIAQEETNIPLMITFDGEWGLAMRLKKTPRFPRNMVLGCISDESLLYAYGKEVGRECAELGVHVNFAPVADVNINPANPVINTRSFGELPANVSEKIIAYSKGLESQNVLAVSKHFPGHGDTSVDSHKSLPVLDFDRARLNKIELKPFKDYINAQLGGVMVGHLHIPALDPENNVPSSLSRPIITGVLKDSLEFGGLVFTDALEMRGVSSSPDRCLQAILAGNDMLLTPRAMRSELDAILQAVKLGVISPGLIEERCKKILTYKYEMGLNVRPKVKLSGLAESLNSTEASLLIDNLEAASITLFKNDNSVLPFSDSFKKIACIYTGDEASYKTLFGQLSDRYDVGKFKMPTQLSVADRNRLEKSISSYDRVLICIDRGDLERYNTFFSALKSNRPIGYLFFVGGHKLHLMERSLQSADLAILAHTSNKVTQRTVSDILLGIKEATGKLAVSIGNSFPAGSDWKGKAKQDKPILAQDLQLNLSMLNHIDSVVDEAIRNKAFPGCQVFVTKDGIPIYDKAFGTFTGVGSKSVEPTDLYDLASVSKTTGTLLAIMKLYDKGLLNLTDYVSKYLPELVGTDKEHITIEELLYHEAGMAAGMSIHNMLIDSKSFNGPLYRASRDSKHTVRLGRRLWANPKYKFNEGISSKVPDGNYTVQIADNLWFSSEVGDSIRSSIFNSRLLTKRYRYSCLGFILLQQVVETVSKSKLDVFLDANFFVPMGLTDICYNPLRYFDKDCLVPSTDDKFLRKEVVQGFVHDELAALQGGVSGNAGQFASARAVATIYQLLLDGGFYKGKRYLSESTCRLFTTKKSKNSRRGLGFDKPDFEKLDKSIYLKDLPAEVFGHTGYTGSCVWADPKNGIVFVLNCNRTYPAVWPNKLAELNIRERIQQAIYDSLD